MTRIETGRPDVSADGRGCGLGRAPSPICGRCRCGMTAAPTSADQARRVIAGLAACDPGQVTDLARTCPVFGPVEAGDPR